MRSDDNLRNHTGLPTLITGEPRTQSPFELAPPGLLVDDNDVVRFILHPQLALLLFSHDGGLRTTARY